MINGYYLVDIHETRKFVTGSVPVLTVGSSAERPQEIFALELDLEPRDLVLLDGFVEMNGIKERPVRLYVEILANGFALGPRQCLTPGCTQNVTPDMEVLPLGVRGMYRSTKQVRGRFTLAALIETTDESVWGRPVTVAHDEGSPRVYGHLMAQHFRLIPEDEGRRR